jgi:hypothetical protein
MRDSDRSTTGLYLIWGRGQPVGIIALLVAHNIHMQIDPVAAQGAEVMDHLFPVAGRTTEMIYIGANLRPC